MTLLTHRRRLRIAPFTGWYSVFSKYFPLPEVIDHIRELSDNPDWAELPSTPLCLLLADEPKFNLLESAHHKTPSS